MNRLERDEVDCLPDNYRPLGAWAYFGYTILFAIPLIGFICLIVFSFSNANINRRNFARSFFCGVLIVLILAAIAVGVLFATGQFNEILRIITDYINGITGR